MNTLHLILRSFIHYRKQHIAVLLASIISVGVLTGALIIGDSVSYSLKKLVDRRLGNIDFELTTGDRFVSSQLAERISKDNGIFAASILQVEGVAINSNNNTRANKVQLIGIDNDFWMLSNKPTIPISKNEIIISTNLAKKLDVDIGEQLLLRIRNAQLVPIDAPFTSNEDQTIALRMTIMGIAGEEKLGRFSLKNNQAAPYNIFINRDLLCIKLGLPNLSNIIVVDGSENLNVDSLNTILKENMDIADYGLELKKIASTDEINLTSTRVFIDEEISKKATSINIPNTQFLSYFVNTIKYDGNEVPYSFVTAVSNNYFDQNISNNDIIINSWLADQLEVKIGDSLLLDYFVIGTLRSLNEDSLKFKVVKIINLENNNSMKMLMPEFPGLSDAGNCKDWDASIPIDLKRIREQDEVYWNEYKGTPKAFITLDKGIELWANSFGNTTSLRFSNNGDSVSELGKDVTNLLSPKDIGLSFVSIRELGKSAAANGVDFGELFLSLSFFIIISAILLMVLVYGLNLKNRSHEIGVLSGIGFSNKQIIRLHFTESIITIVFASIIGGFVGLGYNNIIISALNTIWNDAIHADIIEIHILSTTIIKGILIGMTISILSIYFTLRNALKKTAIGLIQNNNPQNRPKHTWLITSLIVVGVLCSICITILSLTGIIEINSSTMLIAGFLLLLGSVASINQLLFKISHSNNSSMFGTWVLSMKNIARNKARSVSVVALLAIGTFTIIVTGANRLTFFGSENQRSSGTGGTQLWVENTIPIIQNLNTSSGKLQYGLEDEEIFNQVNFIQFNNVEGDDASCLNLNQVEQPQILGVNPYLFDSLNAFSFSTLQNKSNNPWLDLTMKFDSGYIPAIADQTVIQWGLMKSIGDTIKYQNEFGEDLNLVLMGGLSPSIFQGNILISNSNFTSNFPGSGGSNIMLIDGPKESSNEVSNLLSKYLSDYGIEITSTNQRLKEFYSVTNTYLTIFMILGGLGVIIGTIGLGIIIIRNIIERKEEIWILSALGFPNTYIIRLIIIENMILLFAGITVGILAATVGILPSIISQAYHIPGSFLIVLVSLVIISGLIWILIPTRILLKNITSDIVVNS